MKHLRAILACFLIASNPALVSSLLAQDGPPPPSKRTTDRSLPQINVIDKLLAIEAALNVQLKRSTEDQWIGDYQALYDKFMRDGQLPSLPGAGKEEIINAMALGIKASDAVLSLKARNLEALNFNAEQIDQLAVRLGATQSELRMTDLVKRYASMGRWLDAFVALSFLERNILNYLKENGDKKPQAVLAVMGGWLQAGRCVTHFILSHYNAELSNILREGRLVQIMIDEMDTLPPAYKNHPTVFKLIKFLPEVKKRVNVGMRDPVKEEDVKWLHEQFDELVKEITPKGAGSGAGEKAK